MEGRRTLTPATTTSSFRPSSRRGSHPFPTTACSCLPGHDALTCARLSTAGRHGIRSAAVRAEAGSRAWLAARFGVTTGARDRSRYADTSSAASIGFPASSRAPERSASSVSAPGPARSTGREAAICAISVSAASSGSRASEESTTMSGASALRYVNRPRPTQDPPHDQPLTFIRQSCGRAAPRPRNPRKTTGLRGWNAEVRLPQFAPFSTQFRRWPASHLLLSPRPGRSSAAGCRALRS